MNVKAYMLCTLWYIKSKTSLPALYYLLYSKKDDWCKVYTHTCYKSAKL